jgi:hypothetical protein
MGGPAQVAATDGAEVSSASAAPRIATVFACLPIVRAASARSEPAPAFIGDAPWRAHAVQLTAKLATALNGEGS